jgi:Fe-S cluster assembly iron-binding protein IscA
MPSSETTSVLKESIIDYSVDFVDKKNKKDNEFRIKVVWLLTDPKSGNYSRKTISD